MDPDARLSRRQREIAREAVRQGYFAVPRETTLGELSDRLGVPEVELSEELRRVAEKLIREELDL